MQGIFYGIGVGPGDPELMTLKALRLIGACEVLAVAVSDAALTEPLYDRRQDTGNEKFLETCTAYQIVRAALPEVEDKEILYLPMPMIRDQDRLKEIHDICAKKAAEVLDGGKNIACITLGDPTVYSTSLYIHKRLKAMEYETRLIPGVPSFCAAAARLDTGLAENREELHIFPASYGVEQSLELPGTKVLMKAGKQMPLVKKMIADRDLEVQMVENCGMEQERIYQSAEEIPDTAGYYSLLIVKSRKGEE